MVINVPADAHSFRSVEVNSAMCPFRFTGGNQHVINAVFGLEQERVAEVILVIAVRISFQIESAVLGPCLKSGEVATMTTCAFWSEEGLNLLPV